MGLEEAGRRASEHFVSGESISVKARVNKLISKLKFASLVSQMWSKSCYSESANCSKRVWFLDTTEGATIAPRSHANMPTPFAKQAMEN